MNRIEIAARCLQGILSGNPQGLDYKTAAEFAVGHADALLSKAGKGTQSALKEVYDEKEKQDRDAILARFLRQCAVVEVTCDNEGPEIHIEIGYGSWGSWTLQDDLTLKFRNEILSIKQIIAIYPNGKPKPICH